MMVNGHHLARDYNRDVVNERVKRVIERSRNYFRSRHIRVLCETNVAFVTACFCPGGGRCNRYFRVLTKFRDENERRGIERKQYNNHVYVSTRLFLNARIIYDANLRQ